MAIYKRCVVHFQLYKEDVLELLREYPEFSDYSMEQLKTDVEALVGWKNLTPIQDSKRVYTIAEYKNKQYRYTMSEYALEIERMTVKLENLFMDHGQWKSVHELFLCGLKML